MNDRDTIIRMAREAGGLPDPMVFIGAYERFAAMIAALLFDSIWALVVCHFCRKTYSTDYSSDSDAQKYLP